MIKILENDLKECLKLISANWKMQNNRSDIRTNFIYNCNTLKECLNQISINNVDKDYALHRWYNYMTSIACEYLFCDYGAVHEKDIYNHNVDIYINDIPFDVKVTVYPAKLSEKPYDLKTRMGKNKMIEWFYANQSQQSRKQLLNRIYIVCDGDNQEENLKMKSDFNILRERISAFMDYSLQNGINKVQIKDEGIIYKLYSDIIYISYNIVEKQ